MLETPDVEARVTLLRCPIIDDGRACGWHFERPTKTVLEAQIKLAGLDHGRQQKVQHWAEKDTEHAVDTAFQYLGYTSLSTVHRLKFLTITCPKCRAAAMATCACGCRFGTFRPTGRNAGYGASYGVPDRLVAPSWLPPYLFIAIDTKGSRTKFTSPEQERFARERRVAFVRDADQAIDIVKFVRQELAPVLRENAP
jgi:hypothetical protein